jgi:membrane-associated protease RseP (regulator of RpoE activity)
MAYLAGVLVIAVGVALSIALHEIGHLTPAKKFGVMCTQYMVGFGPTVWSRKIGETEYGVKAIPLGGYVRMVGMFPPQPGRPLRADSTGRWALLAQQARDQSQQEIGDVPKDRLFYAKPVWQRLIIMLGGPTMNLIIGAVILGGIMIGYGIPQETSQLSAVSACVQPATSTSTTCAAGATPTPAAAAGLQPGDTIVSFNGHKVSSWNTVRTEIAAAGATTVTLGIKHDGQVRSVPVTLVKNQRYVTDSDGNPVEGADGKPLTEVVGFLGVSPGTANVRQPLSAVPGTLGTDLKQTASVVVRIPQKMVGVAKPAYGSGERDPNGPISIVGVGRVAGEVASDSGSTPATRTSITDRLVGLLELVMSLNLALFIFNLVPLLPLDGGHVAGALWEGARRQVARVRGRADPGPVDVARALPIAYGVASLLIVMSGLLIYADLVHPIRLGG